MNENHEWDRNLEFLDDNPTIWREIFEHWDQKLQTGIPMSEKQYQSNQIT